MALAGLYALWICAPGFRPGELSDFVSYFTSWRGLGIFLQFLVFAGLAPAAARLKRQGFVQTRVAGLFACLSPLVTLDFVFDVILHQPAVSLWMVRLGYLGLVGYGLSDRNGSAARSLLTEAAGVPGWFWRGLSNRWLKLFAAFVAFFLARQELHLFITRSTPSGDETYFWYTASKRLLDEGLFGCMSHHSYMPGLPWLASFPVRLLGMADAGQLLPYSLFVMMFFAALMLELAQSASALLASTTVLFFVFLLSRDLHNLFGATLYGEALAALLTGVLMAEIYLGFVVGADGEPRTKALTATTGARAVGLGLFVSFCSLARPGIAELSVGVAIVVGLLLAAVYLSRPRNLWKPAALVALAVLNFKLWKYGLLQVNRTPEYNHLTLMGFIGAGADFSIPYVMIRGLFNLNSPQAAYSWGLVVVSIVVLCQKQFRLAAVMVTTIVLYWGFTFILYATLWRGMEKGSAGRYLSHAAVGCVLILPLAFTARSGTGKTNPRL